MVPTRLHRASHSVVGYPHIYSYQDIAEAMVVHELTDHDITLKSIRQVINELRREHGRVWPLQQEELSVPEWGRGVVVVVSGQPVDLTAKSPWHGVLSLGNLQRIAGNLRNGGWAVRVGPNLKHIEVHPDRLSRRPTIKGRRIAVADVAEIAELENGHSILRDEYGLTRDEIRDAEKWWQAGPTLRASGVTTAYKHGASPSTR